MTVQQFERRSERFGRSNCVAFCKIDTVTYKMTT